MTLPARVQHVQAHHRLILIALLIHHRLTLPRTLASKFHAEEHSDCQLVTKQQCAHHLASRAPHCCTYFPSLILSCMFLPHFLISESCSPSVFSQPCQPQGHIMDTLKHCFTKQDHLPMSTTQTSHQPVQTSMNVEAEWQTLAHLGSNVNMRTSNTPWTRQASLTLSPPSLTLLKFF